MHDVVYLVAACRKTFRIQDLQHSFSSRAAFLENNRKWASGFSREFRSRE
jgi:hypothetical protein